MAPHNGTSKKSKKKKAKAAPIEKSTGFEENMPDDIPEASSSQKFSPKDILSRAEEYFANLELDLAKSFCEKALSLSPDLEPALILSGEISVERGEMNEAIEHFKRAIEKYPDSNNFAKYLELAQLLCGSESEELYLKGFEIMQRLMAKSKDQYLRKEASEVHCALGELYLTDLCEEEKAEEICASYFKKAHELDNGNPYALQGLANCYISAQKLQDAKEALGQSIDLWLPAFSEALESAEASGHISDYECPLDFEKRKQCAQLLTELGSYEDAEKVLDTLAAEAEDSIEVWYMYGWVNYLRGSEHTEEARAYFNNVLEMSKASDDESLKEIIDHSRELLKELETSPMEQ